MKAAQLTHRAMLSPVSQDISAAGKTRFGHLKARIEVVGEATWRFYATDEGTWKITWESLKVAEGLESIHQTPRAARDGWAECVQTWNALKERACPGLIATQWQDADYMNALCKM